MINGKTEKLALDFARSMSRHHKAVLTGNNEDAKNAVIVKMVALTSLAFGIPAVAGEPLDIEEAMEKLRSALEDLDRYHLGL